MLSKLKLARSILLLIILGSFLSILWLPNGSAGAARLNPCIEPLSVTPEQKSGTLKEGTIQYDQSGTFVMGEVAQPDFLMNFTAWKTEGEAHIQVKEIRVGRDGGTALGKLGVLAINGFKETIFSALNRCLLVSQ